MEERLIDIIVVKRDGKKVAFDGTKVAVAIKKGFDSIEGKYNEEDISKVYNKITEGKEQKRMDLCMIMLR